MKGVQRYELFGGIALINHAFSFGNIPALNDKLQIGILVFCNAGNNIFNTYLLIQIYIMMIP